MAHFIRPTITAKEIIKAVPHGEFLIGEIGASKAEGEGFIQIRRRQALGAGTKFLQADHGINPSPPWLMAGCLLLHGVQHFSDLLDQGQHPEGLGNKVDLGVQHPVMDDGVFRIARHKKHLQLRMEGF